MGNRFSEEFRFLRGPRGRFKELRYVLKVGGEFVRAFRKLHFVGPCVTIFGSARFSEDHKYYQKARELSSKVAQLGFTIMTGGGPGIMEAANRGAKDVSGYSIGCSIDLPEEQNSNEYLDREVKFDHFFVRKVLLLKYSYAFIVFPGGGGTLDELFETFTLIQTAKIKEFPIVIIGTEYWKNITSHMKVMVEEGTISPEDLDLIFVTDSVDEAVEHIRRVMNVEFGLNLVKRKPQAILAEG